MSNLLDAANGINGSTRPMSVSEFVESLYKKNYDPVYCVGEQGLQVSIHMVGESPITGHLLGGSATDAFIALETSKGVKLFNTSNITYIDIVDSCVHNSATINEAAFR